MSSVKNLNTRDKLVEKLRYLNSGDKRLKILSASYFLIYMLFVFIYFSLPDQVETDSYFIEEDFFKQKATLSQSMDKSENFYLISESRPGYLFIEGEWLDSVQLAKWLDKNNFLNKKKNLIIYGGDFSNGYQGLNAINYLEDNLDVNVVAIANP